MHKSTSDRLIAINVILLQKFAKFFCSGLCSVFLIFSERGRVWVKILDAPMCQVFHFENRSTKPVRTTLRDDTVHSVPAWMAPFLAPPLPFRTC